MNMLAWLRRFGFGSSGLRFRSELRNFGDLERLKPVDRAGAAEPRKLLLNGTATATERQERCPGGRSRPSEGCGPVAAARVPQLKPVACVDEAPERGRSAPFVGRDAEFRILLRVWRMAAGGRGRVVLVRSEAGMG